MLYTWNEFNLKDLHKKNKDLGPLLMKNTVTERCREFKIVVIAVGTTNLQRLSTKLLRHFVSFIVFPSLCPILL